MFYYIHLALLNVLGTGAALYTAVAAPCLAALRAMGRCPPPASADEDLSGRVVIVTGANAGVGSRTAFHLARMGAKVIMACRSVERGEMARAKMEQELAILRSGTGKTSRAVRAGTLEVMGCDLCDLSSVRAFARAFEAKHGDRLDVLVNNAGIAFNVGPTLTADGLEPVFGGNFIGHFVLTTELMPLIISTPAARVVCLSSFLHHLSGEDWEAAAGGNLGRWSYPESKLAMVRLAKELNRRFAAAGAQCTATAFAVNPGAVRSEIYSAVPKPLKPAFDLLMRCLFLNTDQGSCPSVCTSAWPLERLSGSDYYQPYWTPFGSFCPFLWEIMGPFVGCAPGRPTLPLGEPAASLEFWVACSRIVQAADASRGDAPGAARG